MDGKEAYFFDTCALIEILLGNEKYRRYRDAVKITTILNLMELNYFLIRKADGSYAKKMHRKFMKYTVPFYDKAILDGNRLKLAMKGASYVDCMGYAMARHNRIKFLTGDWLFKGLEGVEFIE